MSENIKSINALLEIVNDFKNKNLNLLKISLLETNKIIVIKDILKAKFDQNKDIKSNIINTGLRPFIYYTNKSIKNDKNILGKILNDIRNEYYENI